MPACIPEECVRCSDLSAELIALLAVVPDLPVLDVALQLPVLFLHGPAGLIHGLQVSAHGCRVFLTEHGRLRRGHTLYRTVLGWFRAGNPISREKRFVLFHHPHDLHGIASAYAVDDN